MPKPGASCSAQFNQGNVIMYLTLRSRMRSRALPWLCLSLMGTQLAAHAQSSNLITNPGFANVSATTSLPQGYADQAFFSACEVNEDPAAKIAVRYSYGTEGQPYIEIDLTNNSASCTANYNLFLSVANGQISVTPGATYTASAQIKMVVYDGATGGSLGFNLMRANGTYLGGSGTAWGSASALGSYELVTHRYLAGVPVSGEVPAAIVPCVTRYALQPGGHLRMRVQSPSILYGAAATTVGVAALSNPTPWTANGKVLKLSVPVAPIPLAGTYNSRIALVDANGVEQFSSSHAAPFFGSASWYPLLDGWQVTPTGLPDGRYAIRYALTAPPGQTSAGAGAKEVVSPSGSKSYEIGQLVVDSHAGMYVGQHFHRYPGSSETTLGAIKVGYQFARSHDNESVAVNNWSKGDGVYDWTLFDKWADMHAGKGTAASKKLLITFFGSPTWNSSAPASANAYGVPGLTAPPRDLMAYTNMVFDVVNKYKARIFAVECWNEADITGFFAGDPNQLADICKAIHVATKAVDQTIVTICPQPAVPENMKTLLSGVTKANEPVTKFCDVVGAHGYQRNGTDASGKAYGPLSLMTTVASLKQMLTELGVNKPLAITEAGFYDGASAEWADGKVFSAKTGAERGAVIYQTLATARELGVSLYGLYSYDGEAMDGAPFGLEGAMSPNATENAAVYQRMSQATTDLGVASNGLQAMRVDVFQLPSKTVVNYKADSKLSFAVTVTNPGLLPLTNVSIADAVSSTLLVLDSASGAACTSSTTVVSCALGTLNPGESRVVRINAHANPSALQKLGMNLGSKYQVNHAQAVQWSEPVVPATPVNPTKGTPPALKYVVKTASDTKTITVAN
jgi:uncharacterized repeat protein (TIGR01451 family)